MYLDEPENRAKEVKRILEEPWPMEPVLQMKKMNEKIGKFPQNGILFRGNMNRIYKTSLRTLFGFSNLGIQKMQQFDDGMSVFLDETIYNPKSPEEITKLLETTPYEDYGSLTAVVDNGWIVD